MPHSYSSCGKTPISVDEKILTLHYRSRYRRTTEGVLVVDVPAEAMDGDEMTVTIHEAGTEETEEAEEEEEKPRGRKSAPVKSTSKGKAVPPAKKKGKDDDW